MAKAKAKDQTKAPEVEVPKVTEEVTAPKAVKNPYITLLVQIAGLEDYRKTGIRTTIMKTGRGWIRERGSGPNGKLSVTLEGVTVDEKADAGDEFEVEGEKVPTALVHYTFSEDVLVKHGITVSPPAVRKSKPIKTEEVVTATEPQVDETAATTTEEGDTAPSDW